jgi:protochlorophyllide reductase
MSTHWTTNDIGNLRDKVALVTGANSGLGYVIASELARAGATVLLGCRNQQKANDARDRILSTSGASNVEVLDLDLANLSSVANAASTLNTAGRPLHLLINNAGLMALDKSTTVDGFETQFGVNHLGHFALTAGLLPLLTATKGSRIVTMSSMGHRAGKMHFDDLMFEQKYDRWRPYFQSKLANLLFTYELHRRLQHHGHATLALTAHPGGSRTDLGTEGKGLSNSMMSSLVPLMTQSAEVGAQPALRGMGVGHAVKETPSHRARNPEDARRLWKISEDLTNCTMLSVD